MTGPQPLLLAEIIRRAAGAHEGITLSEAVRRSRATGAREMVTIETVFTEALNPLDLLKPRSVRSTSVTTGLCSVLWFTDEEGEWFLAAWPSGHDHVYHLVTTVHSTHSRWKRVERWIRAARGILRTFLDHSDFENIGLRLSALGSVEVGRVTARSVIDGSSDSRGWQAKSPSGRPSPSSLLTSMESDFYSVRTMTIHVDSRLSLHLRRVAGATFYSGSFKSFSEHVLDSLANASAARRNLVVGRARRPKEPARPLRLALPTDLLAGYDATGTLLGEVAKLPNTTLAVFHRNPYLHVAVTDEIDGSSFDVIVTEPNSIDIYPGFRSTTSALVRITQALSDRFGADEIEERPEGSYSLADLSLG